MRAVGIVMQTGAYFFLAASVPRFGSSSSANATLATDNTAKPATANIMSLRPLPALFSSTTTFSAPATFDPLAITTNPRRLVVVLGCLVAAMAAEPVRKVEAIVIEAICCGLRICDWLEATDQ
ncbi:hypothetical protein Hanom_Chr02g00158771 [Helianthus anomalus]